MKEEILSKIGNKANWKIFYSYYFNRTPRKERNTINKINNIILNAKIINQYFLSPEQLKEFQNN